MRQEPWLRPRVLACAGNPEQRVPAHQALAMSCIRGGGAGGLIVQASTRSSGEVR